MNDSAAGFRTRWTAFVWVGVGGAIVFLLVVAATAVPPSPGFSGTVTTPGVTGCTSCGSIMFGHETLPRGANVSLRWSDQDGGTVGFLWGYVVSPDVTCGPVASSGNCSFISLGGNYTFGAVDMAAQGSQVVAYVGTYG